MPDSFMLLADSIVGEPVFWNMEFPRGFICGDDGFLGYMAITNFLTTDYEWDRIHYPPHPTFVFEAYLSPFRLFRQHRRRLIGAVTRKMIFDVIRSKQINHHPDAGVVLKGLNKENPEWLNEYIASQIKKGDLWSCQCDVFYTDLPNCAVCLFIKSSFASLWLSLADFGSLE